MGIFNQNEDVTIKIIASEKNWIESDAIDQLKSTARLKGIRLAVGLPDLHPGKGHPIGATLVSEEWIYPQLVGNDIGCGMGFWKTSLKLKKFKMEKSASKLEGLDSAWEGDTTDWLKRFNLDPTPYDRSLGTIGRGNHFAELQAIDTIMDQTLFEELEIDRKSIYLLVHSGSRGLGEDILQKHLSTHGNQGIKDRTEEAEIYIKAHNNGTEWAEANRSLIAHRFLSRLGAEGSRLLDVCHNMVTPYDDENKRYWLHRKGASPSTDGIVIIPGSRGDLSYLVKPIGDQDKNAFSLAHGAGRKWSRSHTKGRLSKYRVNDFLRTKLGSYVICEDKNLIYEEAPQAYKNIHTVIEDLVNEGLIKIISTLRPLITYKTRRKKND